MLFFNEPTNRYSISHTGYHDLSDTAEHVDFDYATDIAKVAIATAAVLSQQGLTE